MNLEHISILKELIRRQIHPISGDIMKALNKGIIRRLGDILNIENIRIFLSNTTGRKMLERQIAGDTSIWKEIDIEKVKSDVAVYKNFYFIKIKYSNDNGRLITIGYLGIYKNEYLTDQELGLLELLCLLYGDYIRKRISYTVSLKAKQQLPNLFQIAYSENKPGTIITKCQNVFHRSINAYASYYCVIDGDKLFIEYLKLKNTGGPFFPKSKPLYLSNELLSELQRSKKSIRYEASDKKLKTIFNHFYKYDNNINDGYLLFFYPAKLVNEILGVWIFVFSNKQFFDSYELEGLIEIATPIIQNNYKYIFQRRTKKMITEPIFRNRDTRIDFSKVFVLMPFTLEWSNRIWQQMIKPTIEKVGLNPVRADDLFGHDIMEDIWSSILSSNIIVADITGRNPNVFYELGIAHTLGKKVILITQNKDDIPFDLNRYRHIIYQDNFDGYELLKKKLEYSLKELVK